MALPHVSHLKTRILPEPAYQTPLLSGQQIDCINRMVGAAFVDLTVRHRLVDIRDATLCTDYDLTPVTWSYLEAIEAHDLQDFCEAVLKLQERRINHY